MRAAVAPHCDRREPKTSDQEAFESIPWEELRDLGDTSRRRRLWILVGGATLLAVIIFSVTRSFSSPDPLIAPVVPTGPVPDPMAAPPPSQTTAPNLLPPDIPELPREADLMAGIEVSAPVSSPGEWQAASYSEWYVLEFFTLDGSDRRGAGGRWLGEDSARPTAGALSHVEWVRALAAEPLGDGRWKTQVAFRRLVSTEGGGHTRLPAQAVEVVVNMNGDAPTAVDLPRFIPLPEAGLGQWWLVESPQAPSAAVITTATEEMAKIGADPSQGDPRISRAGEAWRVEWAVVDEAGIAWPVSLWVRPDGTPVAAGG